MKDDYARYFAQRDRYYYLKTYTHEVYVCRGEEMTRVATFTTEADARQYVRLMNLG